MFVCIMKLPHFQLFATVLCTTLRAFAVCRSRSIVMLKRICRSNFLLFRGHFIRLWKHCPRWQWALVGVLRFYHMPELYTVRFMHCLPSHAPNDVTKWLVIRKRRTPIETLSLPNQNRKDRRLNEVIDIKIEIGEEGKEKRVWMALLDVLSFCGCGAD